MTGVENLRRLRAEGVGDPYIRAERGYLLSRLMFGWILDGLHDAPSPHFTLTSDEYVARMEDVARREADA